MTLFVLNLVGVGVFAASGALAAGRKGMDWMGVVVLAVVTALGGGTIRDVLLDRHPVFWVRETANLWAALAAAGLTLVWVRFRQPPRRALLIADGLGLSLFSIGGAQVALYATAAIAGISAYLGLQAADLARVPAALAGMALIAALRFTAILLRVGLPTFRVPEDVETPPGEGTR
jgi:uncharacterized membrane protein YeiH